MRPARPTTEAGNQDVRIGGRNQQILSLIRDDLRHFESGDATNQNQGGQPSMTTAQQQVLRQQMLDYLMKQGYDKEAAIYALKRVHYESCEAAVQFLQEINSAVNRKNSNVRHTDYPSSSTSLQQQRQQQVVTTSTYANGHRPTNNGNGAGALHLISTTNYEDSGSSRSNSPLQPQMPSPTYGGMRGHSTTSYSMTTSQSPSSVRHTPLGGDLQTSHIKLTLSPHQKNDPYSQQLRNQSRPSIIIDQGGGNSSYFIRDVYKTPQEGVATSTFESMIMGPTSMGGPSSSRAGYKPSPPSYNASAAHSSVPPPGVSAIRSTTFTGSPRSVVNINVTPGARGNGSFLFDAKDRDGNPIDRFAMPGLAQGISSLRLEPDEKVLMSYEDGLLPSSSRLEFQELIRKGQERMNAAAAAAGFSWRPSTSATTNPNPPPSYSQAINQSSSQSSPLVNSVTSSSSSYMISSLSTSTSSSHHQNRVVTPRDKSPTSRHSQPKHRMSNTTTYSSSSSPYHQQPHSQKPPISKQNSIYRSSSPLPPSISKRLERGTYENCIAPVDKKMFKFYIEQHLERLIIQHKERNKRHIQLHREMADIQMGELMKQKFLQFLHAKESQHMRLRRQKLSVEMFDVVAGIGIGAFGKVSLVKKKDTGKPYAMKTLSKRDIIQKQQMAHVKAERDILAEADSKWIVRLYFSFQDDKHLYFIMEYVPGGDLMQLLINKGIFAESLAKFYTAELTCALEYVHSLNFIHRDIKPDNILIDQQGHIKLTDFGLCTGLRWTHQRKYYQEEPGTSHQRDDSMDSLAMLPNNFPQQEMNKVLHRRNMNKRYESRSVVGTGNYMAPEVIMREGHTELCDWWSVGVILYEMVFGRPPFLSMKDDPEETKNKILNWSKYLDVSKNAGGGFLSRDCVDIIKRLICGTDKRLGSGKGRAKEIMAHPWFKDVDFGEIRKSKPEYIPKVNHPTDTSNFDNFELSELNEQFETMSKEGPTNPAFYEFTFRQFFDGDETSSSSKERFRPGLEPIIDSFKAEGIRSRSDTGGSGKREKILVEENSDDSSTAI